MTAIRVLLAEDQAMIREALAALLSFEDDIEVVAQVGRGDEVAAAALTAGPDVALLDIEMPGMDGLAAAAALRRVSPDTKIVILTTFGRPGYLRRARRPVRQPGRRHDRRDRRRAVPVRGHRPQLPVRLHPEDRRAQPDRGAAPGAGTWLAVTKLSLQPVLVG